MLAAVAARLEARVPVLAGRVQGAADLADLQRRKALPQWTPAAFVLPLGLRGGVRHAVTPLFVQDVEATVGVVLVIRSWGRTGAEGGALVELETLIGEVLAALTGWGPEAEPGVLVLRAGRMVAMNEGTMVWQIDLALPRQLRHHPEPGA